MSKILWGKMASPSAETLAPHSRCLPGDGEILEPRNNTKEAMVQSEWDVYFRTINDKPASIIVDLGLMRAVPIPTLSHVVIIRIPMKTPRPDGLWSVEEQEALLRIDEHLESLLATSSEAVFAGRMMHDGYQEYCYYGSSEKDWAAIVREGMKPFPDYQPAITTKIDPDWVVFKKAFCPNRIELRTMQDNRVLRALESHGDRLTAAREITHWAYFESRQARDAFQEEILALGYKLVSLRDPDGEMKQFSIAISRYDAPTHENIPTITIPLQSIAEEHGGEYDGWETQVEKE